MHVDDCIKFKRYHMLERCNQQNFVLNTIWMIISNAICLNKLLIDDTCKESFRGQKRSFIYSPNTKWIIEKLDFNSRLPDSNVE